MKTQKIHFKYSQIQYFSIFILAIILRILFIWISERNPNDYVPIDSMEYGQLMERVINGDFNFDIGRFVRSPLYPILMAMFKICFGIYWEKSLIGFQVILSGLTCVFISKIAKKTLPIGSGFFFAGILSTLFLPSFYLTGAFTTETIYQFTSVIGIYYFLSFLNNKTFKNLIFFSLSFAVCYLNRSEIIFYFPFLWFLIISKLGLNKKSLVAIITFISIICLLCFPWGVFNLKKHGEFITSSNGAKYIFYIGNSEIGYTDGLATPKFGTDEYKKFMGSMAYTLGPIFDTLLKSPQSIKQDKYLDLSVNWIKENPFKFFQLKAFNVFKFFVPGLSWHHHSMKIWIVSFILCLPFYLLFWIGLKMVLKEKGFKSQLWFIGKVVSSVILLVVFLFTERFRAYSIEIFYTIYAGYALEIIFSNLKRKITLKT